MSVNDQTLDKIFAGNRHTLRFPVLDQDAGGSPLPAKDITGLRLVWAMARINVDTGKFLTAPILVKDSDVAGDITRPDDTGGIVEVELKKVDTNTLGGFTYYWELETIDGTGEKLVVATGEIEIDRNVAEAV